MEKFSNNERRADKQMQRNITTNEKQVHRAYMRANTGMLEKAVCDDKGGLALMEILDYAWNALCHKLSTIANSTHTIDDWYIYDTRVQPLWYENMLHVKTRESSLHFENTVILISESRFHQRKNQESLYIKAMDYCSDNLKVMMKLEQGKKLHESWDPYLPMIRDEMYENFGRVEKRELFTIESVSDEQESSSEDDEIPMDSRSMPYH